MDVVDVLLEIQKKNNLESEKGGISLTRDNIKGIIVDMFTGGIETISTTMNWAMTDLIKRPEMMKKVQTEIRDIMQSRQRVTEDDTTKMEYLKAVIKETYRFHPTVPLLLPRESLHNVNIHGYDIPSGTRVIFNMWAIGRDPQSWDNPEVFAPERFLKGGSASDRDFRGMSFELIPFGAGRRGCPGISYATPVIELVLASLLHKFDWSLPNDIKVEDLDVSESFGVTLVKKYPLNVVATAAAT
uniref:Cytochrome P450 n=1 Tax=Kalanchoe fedtschenkoi TaxID=63787 RepID=A0A7N0SXP3_KALFE